MNGFEDRSILWRTLIVGISGSDYPKYSTYSTNVTRRSQTQTSNETGAHVRKDVSVQVWHHHDAVGKWRWVLSDLQTSKDPLLGEI